MPGTKRRIAHVDSDSDDESLAAKTRKIRGKAKKTCTFLASAEPDYEVIMNSMFNIIHMSSLYYFLYREFHETCLSFKFIVQSIHTKDESKNGTAIIFGVN